KIYYRILRELNKRTGILNKNSLSEILVSTYYSNKVQNKFIEYLNNQNYDIVVGVSGEYSLLLGIISDRLNAMTIGWQHNSYEAYFETRNKYFWNQDILYKKYLGKLNKYIVLTDHDNKMLKDKFNINCNRIYNPLSFKSKEKSDCKQKNIVSVCRLVEQQKGLDLLIKSFYKICKSCSEWTLTIVGDGPDKDRLNKLIDRLEIGEQVKIEPFTNKVQNYYLNSSIFVSSSRWEGFGLVITEAMECGLPIISFANSGPKEIINQDGKNGILIPCENTEELSKAMLMLINNYEKRIELSIEAIKRADDFSINAICNEWREIFDNINTSINREI
ncbi:glycosyltransferase family 4 protein, partial [Clostridium beijerinckii]|uniref:glycosyltransferase family 4 protein n=1 Tax=Clostridium beijerinckii TaxID=1520 RepID=UPI0022E310BA